ncbi:MAG: hypothetical protein JWR52_1917 [Marmoricola sp.]|nr:hypothetical protein [Marmoricola sp.]
METPDPETAITRRGVRPPLKRSTEFALYGVQLGCVTIGVILLVVGLHSNSTPYRLVALGFFTVATGIKMSSDFRGYRAKYREQKARRAAREQ